MAKVAKKPTRKLRKPTINVSKMFLLLAEQQQTVIEELVYTTPSHAWRDMTTLRHRANQLVHELKEIVEKQ
jgi:hypothetical protein